MLTKNRKFAVLLVIVLLISSISQVYANNAGELKTKQKDINTRLKGTKSEIDKKASEANSISEEMAELDRKMDEVSKEIQDAEEKIKLLQEDIDKTNIELDEAEKLLEEKKEIFNERIKVMYMNGNTGYLEILLSAKDVQDFLSRKDMVQAIAEHDKKLLEFIKEQKDLIEAKKTHLENQRAEVQETKAKLESKRQDLEEVSNEKMKLMKNLENDIKALEAQYDKLNSDAQSIESKILKLQNVSQPFTGGKMAWPVPSSGRINSYFGYRMHPVLKRNKLHTGLDIGAPTGAPVIAASSGTVMHSGRMGSYGNTVMIDHGGGIVTLYAHNSALVVSRGQKVTQGQTIAKVGSTGMSTGPHCHFEVRKNGAYVDPMGWLKGN